MTSIYIFVLSSVYLVEYTLHQNVMIEIYTRNFDRHITVPSPNLAFLCRNLDYKPYSIIQSLFIYIYITGVKCTKCSVKSYMYNVHVYITAVFVQSCMTEISIIEMPCIM